jgi:CubicO group peptidase (beta-lactamase class C family)
LNAAESISGILVRVRIALQKGAFVTTLPITAVYRRLASAGFLVFALAWNAAAQGIDVTHIDVTQRLDGFDAYMAKTLKDWNAPGVGVGIVVNDKLVFAKGYGYRDYEKKLPFTPATMSPIASNTKLFTAVAAGMLVEEGKLTWDKPVRESVPAIRFFNDQLNDNVTLRDMLSHRTGITRHDTIWFKSDFTRKELFEKLVYLEAAGTHARDISVQQPDVRGGGVSDRTAVWKNLGAVCQGKDLRSAGHGLYQLQHR